MMYHSKPGALDAELAEIDRCMPHYCKITDNHGIGADRLMQAEAAFTRGQLDDAMIALERTYAVTFSRFGFPCSGRVPRVIRRWGAMSYCSNSTMSRGYAFGMPAVPTIMRCLGRKKRYRSRSACIGWRA